MKKYKITSALLLTLILACTPQKDQKETILIKNGDTISISKETLQDKIKGGWAGQVIGCTFGGPTEFKYRGTMIQDYQTIQWNDSLCKWWFMNDPGLYDDIYMDLTFVEVLEKEGLDAPAESHAQAFARADYKLWHANQAARYNILQGIMPPESGNWKNNPHSDDIDFQIEADFAGLMSPGMAVSSAKICDKVGHIMNCGDGYYGGVYVAAMYSLAFVSSDINFIVSEGLKSIPAQSQFYQCISDVIEWRKQYPDDWKDTWFECQKKWSSEVGCPDGIFEGRDIDAKINAAYVVIGLLYGNGDYSRTMEVSTRCGQDSDCNPATAGGILGAVLGYNKIPDYWKNAVKQVENMDFKYTDMSLNKVYEISYRHAAEMIKRNGGSETDAQFSIKYQAPEQVAFEIGFDGLKPVQRINLQNTINSKHSEYTFGVTGCGFVITGEAMKDKLMPDIVLELDVSIDGKFIETVKMLTNPLVRKLEVYWNYDLLEGQHEIKLSGKIPDGYGINVKEVINFTKN